MRRVSEFQKSSVNGEQAEEREEELVPLSHLTDIQPNLTYPQALKKIVLYSGPYAASGIIGMAGGFLGVVFVSRLGPNELAASNLASSIQNWFTSSMGASLSAVSIIAGRKIGSGVPGEVGSILHQGWVYTWIVSAPSIAAMLGSGALLKFLGQDPAILKLTNEFFLWFAWGLPAMFMLSCNRRITLVTKNSHIAFCFDLFYQCLDTFLSYGFIFGKFFLPKIGFAGLAYSNTLTAWITLGLFSGYLAVADRFRAYRLVDFTHKDFSSGLLQLAKIGLPIGLKVGAELAFLLVASIMIGSLGPKQEAAQEAAFQYIFLISPPMYATMDAVGALSSMAVGSKNIVDAKRLGYAGTALGVSFYLVTLALFVSIPKILLRGFVDVESPDSKSILEIGRHLMIINGLAQIPDAIRNIVSGGLSGFYDTFIQTLLIILTQLIALAVAYAFGFPLGLGAEGIMIARGLSMAVGAILLLVRFVRTNEAKMRDVTVNAPSSPILENDEDTPLMLEEKATSQSSGAWPEFFRSSSPTASRVEPIAAKVPLSNSV
jgi:MATE family multidrug resistance protein